MIFSCKDLPSMQTLLVLGLVALLSGATAQDALPGNIPNNNDNPVIVDPNGNPLPPSTVKTTTIKTEAPTTRPTIKTTLGPQNVRTTDRVVQTFKWTDLGPTKDYNLLFTTKKPYIDPQSGGNNNGNTGNIGSTGSGHRTRHHLGLLATSILLLVALFCSR